MKTPHRGLALDDHYQLGMFLCDEAETFASVAVDVIFARYPDTSPQHRSAKTIIQQFSKLRDALEQAIYAEHEDIPGVSLRDFYFGSQHDHKRVKEALDEARKPVAAARPVKRAATNQPRRARGGIGRDRA